MTRDQIKDVIEGIGIFAVIASLIFVGIETRNGAIQAELNTEAIEMAAYQELIQSINDMNGLAIQEPLLRSAIRKINSGQADLSEEEASQADWYLWMRIRHGDMAYFQYQRGAIDELRLRSTLAPLFPYLSSPFGREQWDWRQEMFAPEYRDYLNDILDHLEETGDIYRPFSPPAN